MNVENGIFGVCGGGCFENYAIEVKRLEKGR